MVGVHHEMDMVRISTLVQERLHLLRIIRFSGCWHLITQPYHGICPRLLDPHGTPSWPRPGAGNAFVDAFIVQPAKLSRCHGEAKAPRRQGWSWCSGAKGQNRRAKWSHKETRNYTDTWKKLEKYLQYIMFVTFCDNTQESLICKWQAIQLEAPGACCVRVYQKISTKLSMTSHDFCSLRMFEVATCFNVTQCQHVPAT